jgi:hypothetical protein
VRRLRGRWLESEKLESIISTGKDRHPTEVAIVASNPRHHWAGLAPARLGKALPVTVAVPFGPPTEPRA